MLDGGHSAVAGRIVGALRGLGRSKEADDIIKAVKSARFDVRESDPFRQQTRQPLVSTAASPIAGRINLTWDRLRQDVTDTFPPAPGKINDRAGYLRRVEETYEQDAYHSLSIEGYTVTPALIERVRQGGWNPHDNEDDKKNRDALAARGYWQAFQRVKQTIGDILAGGDAGALVSEAQREWCRELFQPSVAAGLTRPGALAGYRDRPVFLRGSRHVPPRAEAVPDGMNALFQRLRTETDASVRAVLGHWLIGYIHPYPDGNGRTARFVMNALLFRRRLPLDHCAARRPVALSRKPGSGEHRSQHSTIRHFTGRARPADDARKRLTAEPVRFCADGPRVSQRCAAWPHSPDALIRRSLEHAASPRRTHRTQVGRDNG